MNAKQYENIMGKPVKHLLLTKRAIIALFNMVKHADIREGCVVLKSHVDDDDISILELTEDFKEYMVHYLPENFDHTEEGGFE